MYYAATDISPFLSYMWFLGLDADYNPLQQVLEIRVFRSVGTNSSLQWQFIGGLHPPFARGNVGYGSLTHYDNKTMLGGVTIFGGITYGSNFAILDRCIDRMQTTLSGMTYGGSIPLTI